jgi:hypothetical protein
MKEAVTSDLSNWQVAIGAISPINISGDNPVSSFHIHTPTDSETVLVRRVKKSLDFL